MTGEQQRGKPPWRADERTMLASWLDWHRATLRMKCDGLSTTQLRERAVPPSPITLLGLVRHLADVERGWFRRGVAGEDAPPLYYSDENPEGDFADVDGADPGQALDTWNAECERAREIIAAAGSLDDTCGSAERPFTVRWVLVHMIEEYARHNGHADFLRERIDGVTGS